MARARAKLTRLLGLPETTDVADKVSALVAQTDCEEGDTEWRAGIDVSGAFAKAAESSSIRDQMKSEHAAYYKRAAVRAYADHSRSLHTRPSTVGGWRNSITDADWQSHERWQQHRRLEQGAPSAERAPRFSGHDSLTADEALLVATSTADPMCPYFLFALAVTSHEIYAVSRPLLASLKTKHLDVANLCGWDRQSPVAQASCFLQAPRMSSQLVVHGIPTWSDYHSAGRLRHEVVPSGVLPSMPQLHTDRRLVASCSNCILTGDAPSLLSALRTLVSCDQWWATLTSIDLVLFPYRSHLPTTAEFLQELAAAIVSATSLRHISIISNLDDSLVTDREAREAAEAASKAARAYEALEAAEPEPTEVAAHHQWREQKHLANNERKLRDSLAQDFAARAAEEQTMAKAEKAVLQACRASGPRRIAVTWQEPERHWLWVRNKFLPPVEEEEEEEEGGGCSIM